MYQKKAFNRREQDYAMGLRRKLEEAEAMLQHLAPSRARSLALTKLDEALLWANVGIAEAGLQQSYTAVPRNRGFDFDDALATNVDGQQVRATRAGDITLDGMKIVPRRDENHAVTAQNAAPSAEGDLVLLKPGQVAIDAGRLAKLVEESAQKEAAMGKDGAPHHLAELELLARAQKDWYYAMMSYIMVATAMPRRNKNGTERFYDPRKAAGGGLLQQSCGRDRRQEVDDGGCVHRMVLEDLAELEGACKHHRIRWHVL